MLWTSSSLGPLRSVCLCENPAVASRQHGSRLVPETCLCRDRSPTHSLFAVKDHPDWLQIKLPFSDCSPVLLPTLMLPSHFVKCFLLSQQNLSFPLHQSNSYASFKSQHSPCHMSTHNSSSVPTVFHFLLAVTLS